MHNKVHSDSPIDSPIDVSVKNGENQSANHNKENLSPLKYDENSKIKLGFTPKKINEDQAE